MACEEEEEGGGDQKEGGGASEEALQICWDIINHHLKDFFDKECLRKTSDQCP